MTIKVNAPSPLGPHGWRAVLAILTALVVTAVGTVSVGMPQASAATSYTPPVTRQQVDLDGAWTFNKGDVPGAQASSFNDTAWGAVTVPHTWNATDGADGGSNYYQGIGWYRRHVTVPTALSGKMLYLEFDGVNQVADVWVNGVHVGQHIGGYARFRFVVKSAFVLGKDNVIAVKVDNSTNADYGPQRADYTFQGGIYRGVRLWAVDQLQVRMLDYAGPGVYLRQRAVNASSATVDVTSKLFNNDTVSRSAAARVVVTDATGSVVVDATSPAHSLGANSEVDLVQTFTISNPHRWDGLTDPYLYHATVEVHDTATSRTADVITQPLGLRSYSIDAGNGFALNGHAYRLHGVDLHQDYAGVGWAETPADHQKDWDLIKELGANVVRLAHYEHDQSDYDHADTGGVVLWSEIPNIDFTTDSAAYTTNTENSLRELIRQDYNHPSIVFWGIGNEQRNNDTATNALLTKLAGDVHSEDPDRISTYASAAVSDTGPVNAHTDVNGYNKYYGWYDGTYDDLAGWADTLHAAAPTKKIALSEFGAGANVNQHMLNPTRADVTSSFHPEEYQSLLHEQSWKTLNARPYIWGTFVWNLFDFASDSRAEGGQRGINDKGLVTRDRTTRKDAFYFYKASWSTAPTLYITSRRWTGRTAATTDVKVYSNASTVSLTVNGTSWGSRAGSNRTFTWTGVTLAAGRNTVAVTATINGSTQTDSVVWNLS